MRAEDAESILAILRRTRWASAVSRNGKGVLVDGASEADGAEINRLLVEGGLFASVIKPVEYSLADVFFELTEAHPEPGGSEHVND